VSSLLISTCHTYLFFQGLHDAVSRCDASTIQAFLDHNPEDLQPLAVVLLERLETSPHALRLLVRLSKCEAPRNTVLNQSQDFLDGALKRASTDTAHSDQLFDLCVNYLSVQLPMAHVLPASAEDFFLRVFNGAVKDPCLTTLLPIYALLNGACEVLMNILPRNSLDYLRDELLRMMRSVKAVEDQVVTLLCLAILVKLLRSY
jgi:hypothetical protein